MPAADTLVPFVVASVILIVIPGPSVLFVIGRSLAYGRRGGFMSALGNSLGTLPLVAAVAFGVGTLVAQSIVLFTIIKLLGAAYVIYLGIQAIRGRRAGSADDARKAQPSLTPRAMLWQGTIVGVTNPKTIVFFVAVLPQFVSFSAGAIPLQMMVLGLLFIAIGLTCDFAWAVLAGTAQEWFARSPKRLAGVRATGGVMMIGLGTSLVFSSNKL